MEENEDNSTMLPSLLRTKLLGELYGDLAKPGVQQVGKALGTVLELANTMVVPIWMINQLGQLGKEVLKKNMDRYMEKIQDIPDDKRCEVQPEIGVPIIQRLTYTSNEEIREAYVQLLAKASSADTAQLAHPAFISIIERLSSDEALLLKAIYSEHGNWPYFTASIMQDRAKFAIAAYKWRTGLESEAKLNFPNNVNLYFENLKSLSLIDFVGTEASYEFPQNITAFNYYPDLRERLMSMRGSLGNAATGEKPIYYDLLYEQGEVLTTEFGHLFMQTCTTVLDDREERYHQLYKEWSDSNNQGSK